jgi:hypothetical protein
MESVSHILVVTSFFSINKFSRERVLFVILYVAVAREREQKQTEADIYSLLIYLSFLRHLI